MSDREEMQANRAAGVARRNETRHERAQQREEIERLRALLAEAAEALVDIGKKAIVVKPALSKPYVDAPDLTPWTRFMEAPARRAYNLGVELRREIGSKEATPPAPKCARCRGQRIVPDFTNWDEYHGEPKPKPCPDCALGEHSSNPREDA